MKLDPVLIDGKIECMNGAKIKTLDSSNASRDRKGFSFGACSALQLCGNRNNQHFISGLHRSGEEQAPPDGCLVTGCLAGSRLGYRQFKYTVGQ
jgi:hypothetical protein